MAQAALVKKKKKKVSEMRNVLKCKYEQSE